MKWEQTPRVRVVYPPAGFKPVGRPKPPVPALPCEPAPDPLETMMASLVAPGLGQIALGRVGFGICMLVLMAALWALYLMDDFRGGWVLFLLHAWIGFSDGAEAARRQNARRNLQFDISLN